MTVATGQVGGQVTDRLLTDFEAMELLGVKLTTVRKLRRSGELKTVRIEGCARVRLSDVMHLVNNGTK
jgi:excisionase family DNA binding protein